MKVQFEDGGSGGKREPKRDESPARPLKRSIVRGLRGRCPVCGTGHVFDGYLAVAPACSVCGEELHHHRADDLPPYLTILIVGHLVVSGLLVTERMFRPEIWIQMAVWLPMTALLALLLIRPIKGGVVGLQWALRMHGFGRKIARTEGTT
ncbi:DUF983 domain-containing protein [Pinisolibacter sp.]|uniref:DUF983 domain-containing protein n=1 Tax=Pinisolibacter sp. TaxID=2172024 RepID=UPI002FDC81B3